MTLRGVRCLFGLALAGAALGSCADSARAGLIEYWTFDNGSATSAIGGTDGTLCGATGLPTATTDRNGNAAGALAFLGTDKQYVSVAGGGGLNGAFARTVSMWVQWTDAAQDAGPSAPVTTTPNGYGYVLGRQFDFDFVKYRTDGAAMVRPVWSETLIGLDMADPATGKIMWRNSLYWKMSSAAAPDQNIKSAAAATLNTWHHVAAVLQADFLGNSALYVDGALQGVAKLDALAMSPDNIPLTIGAWIGQGDSYSTSSIDDVAVFDDMLSPGQIAALAAKTATPLTVGAGTLPARVPLRGVKAKASSCFYSYSGAGNTQTGRPADHASDGMGRLTAQYDGRGGYAETTPTTPPPVVRIDEDWTSHEGMWLTNGANDPSVKAGGKPWIQFDLGKTYKVGELVLWNYNEAGANGTKRGIKTADISYSTDGISWTPLYDDMGFAQCSPTTGVGVEGDVAGQSVDMNDVTARYVKLHDLVNWGATSSYTGVNEVDFYVVPEPSTAMLLLGAVLGLFAVRRRLR